MVLDASYNCFPENDQPAFGQTPDLGITAAPIGERKPNYPAEGPLDTVIAVAGVTALTVSGTAMIVTHTVADAYRRSVLPEKVGAGVSRVMGALLHLGDK